MPEKALNCVCYMAYTAWKSREILLGQLRRHGMHLFYEIEMPVIYSLYHMEEEGIQVRREELKAYGERLRTQVEKLEQEIYAETGCEFNINSPKQLGEVLFEKSRQAAKRRRPAIRQRRMCWKNWRRSIRLCGKY